MKIGWLVRVQEWGHGPYFGLVGKIVAIHDPSVRLRRVDVQFPGLKTLRCFAPEELERVRE